MCTRALQLGLAAAHLFSAHCPAGGHPAGGWVGAELAAGGGRGRRLGSHTPGEGPLLAERETGQVSIKALRVTTGLGFLPFPPPAS